MMINVPYYYKMLIIGETECGVYRNSPYSLFVVVVVVVSSKTLLK